ncbi:MAG: hypothetical protein PHU46_06855 [Rhodocyclaceae bacterium]|nr:hypothetical protein [Rhodocyclaceae bacterium]
MTIDDAGCFLKSDTLNKLSDRARVYETAVGFVEFINASSKVYSNRDKSLDLEGFWLVDADGSRRRDFIAVGAVSGRIILIVQGNDVAPKDWYSLWQSNENVKYVFRLFIGSSLLDWASLYMIYETIRDDPQYHVGNRNGVENIASWTSPQQNSDFFETANWYRHSDFGKTKGKRNVRPLREMSLSAGNDFIRAIVTHWLNCKSTNSPPE